MITVNPMPGDGCQHIIDYIFNGLERHVTTDATGKLCAVMMMDRYRDGYFNKLGHRKSRYYKTQDLEYTFEQFNQRTFIPDIVEINHSKIVRSGGPMKSHYLVSIEEKGGYPKEYYTPIAQKCKIHAVGIDFGVFKPIAGYKQGEIVTNKKLLAYACIHYAGDFAMYSMVIGHGEHLKDGIMTRLQVDIMNWMLTIPTIKYWLYSAWSDGGEGSGLQTWKKEHLFEPQYLRR